MKLQEFIQKKIMPPINKMQSNIYVSSLMEGMMKMMPVMMGISIISLIYLFPVDAWTNFITSIGLYDLLYNAMMCSNVLALFFCMSIGYVLAGKKNTTPFSGAMISVFCFLVITPGVVEVDESGTSNVFINVSSLSAEAVITSIIVAMVAVSIFAFMVKKNFTIKFPDSVPAFVGDNFAMIPPAFVTLVVFILIKAAFMMTPYESMTNFIYSILQAPLSNVGNTLAGHIVLMLVASILWWCGIHGTAVISPIMTVVLLPGYIENVVAVMSGEPAPYLMSYVTLFVIYTCLGGSGCVFGLGADMALFAKSERYKAQGRLSIIPCIFNISEPLIYGTPVCLNPILFVPFVGLPILLYLLLYFCLSVGLFTTPVVLTAAYVIPGFIMGFLSGGLGFGIFCIVALIISCVVYFPFVKMLDNQALAMEKSLATQEEQEEA